MSAVGISAESLGKRYGIVAARDSRAGRQFARFRRREALWALRDVSFELPPGSRLGIIGRNGAGKTTLLKILSRITPPTEGRAVIGGRVSSLLEVGTGFHPELTGRENVYLNGAVLGMTRSQVASRFDEIAAFAEMDRFIDTPVKRYSSGMTVRLAFAVAAHLETDVLLVDEVLAVGDANFQAKCLGRMGEMTGQGRTVVLVSHNMPTIASLAERCLWLHGGAIAADGEPGEVIRRYLEGTGVETAGELVDLTGRARVEGHAEDVRYRSITLKDASGEPRSRFFEGEPITVEVEFDVAATTAVLEQRAYVKTVEGFWLFSALSGRLPVSLDPGRYRAATTVEPNHLRPGQYRVDVNMQTNTPQDSIEDAVRFDIAASLEGYEDPTYRQDTGRFRLPLTWTLPVPVVSPEDR